MSLPAYYASRSQSSVVPAGVTRVGGSLSTIATYALDSAYTYGTGGDAVSASFIFPETLTLEAFYFVAVSITGTGSADGNINWELREGTTAVANVPGTTVVASGTIAVSALAANTWYKLTLPTSKTITAYKRYDLVIADADGSATNFVTVVQSIRETGSPFFINARTTTNGFTTAPTDTGYQPGCALKFTDGTVIGSAILRASATNTSNTTLRGIKFSFRADGPQMKMAAINWPALGVLRILKGSGALPNTTPEKTYTISPNNTFHSGIGVTIGYPITEEESYVFQPGETYFLVWKPDSNNNGPAKTTAYAGMDADLRSLLGGINGMTCSWVQELTSTTWSEDTDATLNALFFAFVPIVSPTLGT